LHIKCSGHEGLAKEKQGENLSGRRRKVDGGVPSITGKTDEWLVAATATEARRRKWPRRGEEKTGQKDGFFLNFGF